VTDTEEPIAKVRRVETEQEEDGQQLNQASDTAALLQDELIQAADRERQLQMQLDKVNDDVSRLERRLSNLWEQEMKQSDSMFNRF